MKQIKAIIARRIIFQMFKFQAKVEEWQCSIKLSYVTAIVA